MPIFQPNVSSLKEKRDVVGLLKLVKSKDRRIRRAAIQALGEVGDPAAVPDLVEILLRTRSDHAERASAAHAERVDAAEALGMLGDAAAVGPLLQAAATSRELELTLVASAQASPDRTHRPGLSANIISSDEYLLRSTIAQALANIGGDVALRGMFEMLAAEAGPMASSMQTAIQVAITNTLSRGQASYPDVLHEQRSSPSIECRQIAVRSLGELGEAAVELLIGVAGNEDEVFPVRQSAIACLGRIGDIRALPCLDELSESDNRPLARDARYNAAIIRQRHWQPLF